MNGIKNLEKHKLIGLDTNIFVYQFQQHLEFGPKSKIIFDLLSSDKLRAVTSIVSSIEILSIKNSLPNLKMLQELFFSTTNLAIFNVDKTIALETARIRRKYNFRTPDAIQLATAIKNKTKAFITNDKKLQHFKELKIILLSSL